EYAVVRVPVQGRIEAEHVHGIDVIGQHDAIVIRAAAVDGDRSGVAGEIRPARIATKAGALEVRVRRRHDGPGQQRFHISVTGVAGTSRGRLGGLIIEQSGNVVVLEAELKV